MLTPPDAAAAAVALFRERYRIPAGRGEPALATLVARFSELPYENLTKIIASRSAARLRDAATVMRDHFALGTGGTCFSLTELLRVLAAAAGFVCQPLMAHMRHGANIHCALRVEADGRAFLVDPGYLVRRPLPLGGGDSASAATPGEALLVPAGALGTPRVALPDGGHDLYTLEAEGPRWRYRVSPRPPDPREFERHWRASFDGVGMRSLLATRRSAAGELLYLHNHKLRRQRGVERRTLNVRAELEREVAAAFGIDPRVTRRAAELLRAARSAAAAGAG
jgi:arylamine N-acetyltransferase